MPDYKTLAEASLDRRTVLRPAATRRRLESLLVLIRREGATIGGTLVTKGGRTEEDTC
jgi:hypothetical protein